ncbi:MAG TPA: hypothetical protein VFA66_13205 [Gaiellaceae bacterium]|nr:hypothetical protein [Gaiellaceae bacterium]
MSRLRPLTESECYRRLYGDRDSTIAVIREGEPERPEGGLLGEQLRQLFEERFGVARDDQPDAEAA